jgi:hypothetical protein
LVPPTYPSSPLSRPLASPAECRHPALLRLAVSHLQRQYERGERPPPCPSHSQQLVEAGGRAFLGGF